MSKNIWDLVEPVSQGGILFAFKWVLIWFAFTFICTLLLPGKKHQGFKIGKNQILTYKMTGLTLFLQIQTQFFLSKWYGIFSLRPLIQYFWSFIIATTILSFIISIILMVVGRNSKDYDPHKQGWTPQWFNDWWFGAQKNLRLFGVDLKMYFYQPSLIGLHMYLLAFAEYQYDTYGRLTSNMILLQVFEWAYLFTHYIKEDFMLSTWDLIAENFGFMLVWGDSVYVPFLYSMVGWSLADKEETLSGLNLVLVVAFHIMAHYLFRNANWQKYDYRRNGDKARIWGAPPKTIEGGLLVSGWWGIGRHLNYTGEILTYLSFALCSGTTSFIPYILPFSLLNLLMQRASRDDKRCRTKYGKSWEKYCQQAKFMIIPFIY